MHRKLKVMGLALVAALALTAVMASAASAQFTSTAEHTIISGSQTTAHKFTAGSGIGGISCTTATFAGTAVNKTESTQTVNPTYSGCSDSFGRTVHVVSNTLEYHFLSGASKGSVTLTGKIVLTVTSGTPDCTITIEGDQTNNGISYENLGGTSGVKVTTNTNNVKSSVEGGFFACGTSTTSNTAGTYTGTTVVTGKDTAGNPVTISVD